MKKKIALWALAVLLVPILVFAAGHIEPSVDNLENLGTFSKAWHNLHIYNTYQGSTKSLLSSGTAPTISSGFGTSPSVVANNGTAAFEINVGTGGSATSGVIGMPTATTGWICSTNNLTAAASNRADNTRQTAYSTTSVTIVNETTSTGAAVGWTASDKVYLSCFAF
jgi:hypothetical protein